MKIYFDGCSWTRGGELSQEERTTSRWSKLVADHFDAEEKNFSLSGGSNDRIIRNLMDKKNIEEYDLAVIAMTFPARTEYYSGRPLEPKVIPSGWIPVNPNVNLPYVSLRPEKDQDVVNVLNSVFENPHGKWVEHKKFWNQYYRIVTTDTFFGTKEKIQKQTIMDHCRANAVPLVICTINPDTKEDFDLQLNYDGLPRMPKGHPSVEGHRILADQIIEIAESRL